MKPSKLKPITLLMCFFNLCGFVFVNWRTETAALELAFVGAVVVLSFAVLYHFWQGRNWARVLVILTSVLALFNLFLLSSSSIPQQIVLVLEAILACYLFYWLNTVDAKSFFRGKRQD